MNKPPGFHEFTVAQWRAILRERDRLSRRLTAEVSLWLRMERGLREIDPDVLRRVDPDGDFARDLKALDKLRAGGR